MAIEKYRRVIWRLEELDKRKGEYSLIYKLDEVRKAIMQEIGTHKRTIKENMANMIELGYIKRLSRWDFQILVGSNDVE